jgi:hypothetical protein
MSDIAADARLQRDYSALSESLWRAASQQLRNRQAPNVQAQGRTLYRLENCHDAARSDLINLGLKAFLR